MAQILDYALALQEMPRDALPELPVSHDAPNLDDLDDSLAAGKFLLIVAGDSLDPRALRLSQAILARDLTREWDLVMVDLNLYRSLAVPDQLLIVPELRGVLFAEARQVIRVKVEGDMPKTPVVVEHIPADELSPNRRTRLSSVEDFLKNVRQVAPIAAAAVARIVERFQRIESASQGQLALGLQTASANLYWRSGVGDLRRIFALNQRGWFRVWLAYLKRSGDTDLAEAIRQLAQPVVAIAPEAGSGGLFVDPNNVDQILSLVDSVASAVTQPRS